MGRRLESREIRRGRPTFPQNRSPFNYDLEPEPGSLSQQLAAAGDISQPWDEIGKEEPIYADKGAVNYHSDNLDIDTTGHESRRIPEGRVSGDIPIVDQHNGHPTGVTEDALIGRGYTPLLEATLRGVPLRDEVPKKDHEDYDADYLP